MNRVVECSDDGHYPQRIIIEIARSSNVKYVGPHLERRALKKGRNNEKCTYPLRSHPLLEVINGVVYFVHDLSITINK